MMRLLPALALAAGLAAPAALGAQDTTPPDTIVIVTGGGEEAGGDTLAPAPGDTARRSGRWAQPFAVRSSGRAAQHAPAREVVWLHPDSVRRLRRAARDTAGADTLAAEEAASDDEAAADSNEVVLEIPESSSRRRNADAEDEPPARRRNADAGEEDEEAEETPAPSSCTTRRTTTERGDSAAARRTPTRTTARDTAGTRRGTAAPRDTSGARRSTTPAAGGRARTHTVAAGETFFGIARRYGVTTAQLRALNPDADWERLEVGTVLRLPAGARQPAQSGQRASGSAGREAPRPPAAAQRAGRRTHTVAQGETLYGIARRYGVTVAALKAANDLEEDRVRIGQTLVIPRAEQR